MALTLGHVSGSILDRVFCSALEGEQLLLQPGPSSEILSCLVMSYHVVSCLVIGCLRAGRVGSAFVLVSRAMIYNVWVGTQWNKLWPP